MYLLTVNKEFTKKNRVGRDQRSDCRGIPSLLPNIVYNSARILMENVNT